MQIKKLIELLEMYDPEQEVAIDDEQVQFTETGGWEVAGVIDDGLGHVVIQLGEEIDPL